MLTNIYSTAHCYFDKILSNANIQQALEKLIIILIEKTMIKDDSFKRITDMQFKLCNIYLTLGRYT